MLFNWLYLSQVRDLFLFCGPFIYIMLCQKEITKWNLCLVVVTSHVHDVGIQSVAFSCSQIYYYNNFLLQAVYHRLNQLNYCLNHSVEYNHLPFAVSSQIYERHDYQRGNTQNELK